MEKQFNTRASTIRFLWFFAFILILIPALILFIVALKDSKYAGSKLDFQFYAICFSSCELLVMLPLAYFLFIRNAIKLMRIRLSVNSERIESRNNSKTISFKWNQIQYLSECRFVARSYLYRKKINLLEKYSIMKIEYYELYEVGDGKNAIRFNCYYGKNAPEPHILGKQKMLRTNENMIQPSSMFNTNFMEICGITLSNADCNEVFHLIIEKM